MRSEEETNAAIEKYSDMIRRICMVNLKNYADTEDVFQTVFMKYVLSSKAFESEEHEKSWFIRVTINACKDIFKSFFRTKTDPLDIISDYKSELSTESGEILRVILTLPEKYRQVIYLHYYEGYTAPEIGGILGKNENTVYTLLARARKLLKDELAGDYNG
ncbi:MAG: RNA polymerase sigma factor [Ruminococcaceae bacterium]|nr:RNA polymerase sigma factor [Oscillospiraceae bacterium]